MQELPIRCCVFWGSKTNMCTHPLGQAVPSQDLWAFWKPLRDPCLQEAELPVLRCEHPPAVQGTAPPVLHTDTCCEGWRWQAKKPLASN